MNLTQYIAVLFLLLGSLSACATRSAAPEQLVIPWSEDLAKSEAPLPFIAKYSREEKAMVYLAVEHSNSVKAATFVMLREALDQYPPRILLVEGFESNKGTSPREIRDWALADGAGGTYSGGESAYAVQLAVKKKIPFRGLEPDELELHKALTSAGYSSEEMIHYYFLRQVPQWQRAGTLNFNRIESTYQNFARGIAQKIHAKTVPAYGDFTRWYKIKNKEPFNESTVDSEKSAPFANGSYYTQKMSSVVGVVRDRHMVGVIAEELKTRSPIFVVLGGSHWMTQKMALESLGGFPSFEYKPF